MESPKGSGPSSSVESIHARWTIDTLAVHVAALREADSRFFEERDRRYAEVTAEREKALKIKETADLAALSLARDIQIYKDEKANELREQINRERGNYATSGDLDASVARIEAIVKPHADFIARQQGSVSGTDNVWKYIFATAAFVFGILGAIGFLLNSMK